ncbi:hypothetical protein Tco_0719430, partial [Tanacetum coccineum]
MPIYLCLWPSISPSSSSLTKDTTKPPTPVFALPPPHPNEDCTTVTCTQPLTYTPAGSSCACVWPIEVKLRLAISPYTFFPLVFELAHEISTSVSLNVSQARNIGANADGEKLDKTIVFHFSATVPLNGDVTVDQSDSLNNNKGMHFKPTGVDIPRNGRENKSKTNGSMVTVVILSS